MFSGVTQAKLSENNEYQFRVIFVLDYIQFKKHIDAALFFGYNYSQPKKISESSVTEQEMFYKHKRDKTRVIPDPQDPVIIDLVGENFIDVLRAKDIGEGGLSVYVPYQFNGCTIDREIELIITLPQVRSFKAAGMIRHKGQKQDLYFGISFTRIESKDLEKLRGYVTERSDKGTTVK